MEKDLDLIPQKPGGRKQKIERTAKKKKQKNNYKEGDAKSLSVDIVVENPSDNLGDVQRQLDREMQIEIDRVLNSEELSADERSAKIELIKLGYEKRILEEQKRIEIEKISKSPVVNEEAQDSLIKSVEAGYEKKMAELTKAVEESNQYGKENDSMENIPEAQGGMKEGVSGDMVGGDEDAGESLETLKKEIELEIGKTNKVIGEIEEIIEKANVKGETAVFMHNEMGQLTFSKEDIENFRKNTVAMASERTQENLQEIILRREEMEGFVEKYKQQNGEKKINTGDSGQLEVEAENGVIDSKNGDDAKSDKEKELPPIIKKAIRNKEFSQNLFEHEVSEKSSEELIMGFIKEIKKEVYSLIGAFGKKLEEFKKAYPRDTDFQNKIYTVINQYKIRANEFDGIKEASRKDLTKINQLRHEMQKWADRDWIELYRRKSGMSVFEEVTDAIIVNDLTEAELHGEHGFSNDKVKDIETAKKIIKLEDQYGEVGTVYIRYDKKTGFPVDSFEIVGYELGEDEKSTFVITKKLIDDMEVKGKFDLKSFRKNKEYQRAGEILKEGVELKTESGIDEKILSPKELKNLLSSINAIKERRGELGMDKVALGKKFKDFLLEHKEEKEFNKELLKKIHLLDDRYVEIDRKFRKMEESDEMDENILNEINKLDGEIINLVESDWEEELEKFKQNSVNEKFGLNEKEQKIVEKSKEIANKFIEKARAEFPWENFPQKRVDFALETQAVFFLMEEFKKRKFFKGKEEELAEFIVKNRNKK